MSDVYDETRKPRMELFRLQFAGRLREKMRTNKKKNDDLARVTGLALSTIDSITCGRQNVNPMDLVAIAEEVGCSVNFLLTGKSGKRAELRCEKKCVASN